MRLEVSYSASNVIYGTEHASRMVVVSITTTAMHTLACWGRLSHASYGATDGSCYFWSRCRHSFTICMLHLAIDLKYLKSFQKIALRGSAIWRNWSKKSVLWSNILFLKSKGVQQVLRMCVLLVLGHFANPELWQTGVETFKQIARFAQLHAGNVTASRANTLNRLFDVLFDG